MVRNLDLQGCNFWTYIWWYTSPNEIFENGYPHSNALETILLLISNIIQSDVQYNRKFIRIYNSCISLNV